VDGADDPYDITQGFWYAHMGWILFKLDPEPPQDNVADLRKDPLVQFQTDYYVLIAVVLGFLVPAGLGYWHAGWVGALGGFLLAGVARVTVVQHMTFFINSLCHTVGDRPYSDRCSARDSWIMALFTFGEGYHNYHHEFQHDYRNGVKWWQWDPTKWSIWTLEKLRLVTGLRRVSEEKILLMQLAEARRRLDERLACSKAPVQGRMRVLLQNSGAKLNRLGDRWTALKAEYSEKKDVQVEHAKAALAEIRHEVSHAFDLLELASATA
jgi:stearoyl-CoA desaturase (delta-9 desaturase)